VEFDCLSVSGKPRAVTSKEAQVSDHEPIIDKNIMSFNMLMQCGGVGGKPPPPYNNGFGIIEDGRAYHARLARIAAVIAEALRKNPNVDIICLQEAPKHKADKDIFTEALNRLGVKFTATFDDTGKCVLSATKYTVQAISNELLNEKLTTSYQHDRIQALHLIDKNDPNKIVDVANIHGNFKDPNPPVSLSELLKAGFIIAGDLNYKKTSELATNPLISGEVLSPPLANAKSLAFIDHSTPPKEESLDAILFTKHASNQLQPVRDLPVTKKLTLSQLTDELAKIQARGDLDKELLEEFNILYRTIPSDKKADKKYEISITTIGFNLTNIEFRRIISELTEISEKIQRSRESDRKILDEVPHKLEEGDDFSSYTTYTKAVPIKSPLEDISEEAEKDEEDLEAEAKVEAEPEAEVEEVKDSAERKRSRSGTSTPSDIPSDISEATDVPILPSSSSTITSEDLARRISGLEREKFKTPSPRLDGSIDSSVPERKLSRAPDDVLKMERPITKAEYSKLANKGLQRIEEEKASSAEIQAIFINVTYPKVVNVAGKFVAKIQESGNLETMTRQYEDNNLDIYLNAEPSDKAIFVTMHLNKEFSPLALSPCNDPKAALKVFEAAKIVNIIVELNSNDVELMKANEPEAYTHYLQIKEMSNEEFQSTVKGITNRELGTVFSSPSNMDDTKISPFKP